MSKKAIHFLSIFFMALLVTFLIYIHGGCARAERREALSPTSQIEKQEATSTIARAEKQKEPSPTADMKEEESSSAARVKNVIVLIGDGMGNQQRRIAAIVEGKGDPAHRLVMESLSTSGVAFNHSLDALVTDSAAAGTALATGHKTKNGMVSMAPDGKKLKTILELCKEMGKSTGLITTVTIAHATPACYGSHVRKRKMYDEIALQYFEQKIDVLMGGGMNDFLPAPGSIPPGQKLDMDALTRATYDITSWRGKRKDGKNLIYKFQKAGYYFVRDPERLMKVDPERTSKLLGLFSKGAMSYEVDRDPRREPSIAQMTEVALRVLSENPEGFFLMVEGGKIDWACHGNDVAAAVYDTIAFDKAVKVAVDYAEKNPSTLVIVVNDHETGGMTITSMTNVEAIRNLKASAGKMARMINRDGSNVDEIFKKYAGITDLTARERKMVRDEALGRLIVKDLWGYGGTVIAHIISQRTGVLFSTGGHSGTPVIVAAQGPGSEIFDGFYDQTLIPRKIAELLGAEL